MGAEARPPAGDGARPRLARIWAAALLLTLFVATALAALLTQSHGEAMQRMTLRAERLVGSAAATVNRELVAVDLMLLDLAVTLDSSAGAADLGEGSAEVLARAANSHSGIDDLALFDPRGPLLATAHPRGFDQGRALSAAFRERVRQMGEFQLVVGETVVAGPGREPALMVGRLLRLADGRRLGSAALVPTALLAPIGEIASDLPGLVVTLERTEGQLMAAIPRNDRLTGQVLPALSEDWVDGSARQGTSRIGQDPALVAARRTLHGDMTVTVGLGLNEGLAAWRELRRNALVAALAFTALLVGAAALAQGQILALARARRALAQSATTLDQALGAMAEGFLLTDADGHVVRWNERYLEIFPWQRGLMAVGTPFRRLAEVGVDHVRPGASQAERRDWIEQRLASHGTLAQLDQPLPDGRMVQIIERRTADGGVVGIYRDVTANERRLTQARDAAEEANRAKSRFLANMSHEFRTPLNALMGFNALLLQSPLDAGQRQHLELMRGSGQLLLTLIDDILDLARIEAGRLKVESIPFDPTQVVRELVQMLTEQARNKGLRLDLAIAPEAPTCIMGDPARLRQVLFNLLGNAIKFTERGQVALRLERRERQGTPWLVVQVRDTGIGIDPEALPTLFDRFTQADSSTARRYGGSGLGLAIARDVVGMMGGHIDVASQPGQGSSFEVHLPCLDCAPGQGVSPPIAPAGPAPARAALRILVAEDNEVNYIVIEAMLVALGHRCARAADGQAAVRQAAEADFDLVLMDVQMPVMDGLQAARAIRRLPPPRGRVPIVAMTANAAASDREACLAAGMNEHVAKPLSPADLDRALAQGGAVADRPGAG